MTASVAVAEGAAAGTRRRLPVPESTQKTPPAPSGATAEGAESSAAFTLRPSAAPYCP